MSKGISGAALRTWIEEIDPVISQLQRELNMPARTFYDLYKKKVVPWAMVARIHGILREQHVYDINKYFPDFERQVSHLVPEADADTEHSRYVKQLRRDNELLQAKVIDLSEKLNAAYEKIIDSYFQKMVDSIDANTATVKQIVNTLGNK